MALSWGADIEEAATAFWDSTISTIDDIEDKIADVSINTWDAVSEASVNAWESTAEFMDEAEDKTVEVWDSVADFSGQTYDDIAREISSWFGNQ